MKRSRVTQILATAAFAVSSFGTASALTRVTVPGHTAMKLICDSVAVTTAALHPGDELVFHVSEPVIVNGFVVIPQDAKAIGHIVDGGGTEVKQHVFSTKVETHSMTYALDYVMSADGGRIKLNPAVTEPPAEKIEQTHMFFGRKERVNLVGVLTKGTAVPGYVDHLIHVEAKTKASAVSTYDQ